MEKNYIMGSLMICTVHQILFGDQVRKNKMGGACIQGFAGET